MIELSGIGLVRQCAAISRREDIVSTSSTSALIKAASWLASPGPAVRLCAVPAGALPGFNGRGIDLETSSRAEGAIDITEAGDRLFGGLAKAVECLHPGSGQGPASGSFPGGSSSGSCVDPDGEVICAITRWSRCLPVEHGHRKQRVGQLDSSLRPQNLDAFYPVCRHRDRRLGS